MRFRRRGLYGSSVVINYNSWELLTSNLPNSVLQSYHSNIYSPQQPYGVFYYILQMKELRSGEVKHGLEVIAKVIKLVTSKAKFVHLDTPYPEPIYNFY